MVTATAVTYLLLVAASIGVTGGLATYAWRNRREPGAYPFVALMAAVTLWSVFSGLTLLTPDPATHRVWERAQYVGIVFVPVAWLLFALSYTGYERFVSARATGLLSAVPLATLALAWTNRVHGLMWLEESIVVERGVAAATHVPGPAFWAFTLYAYVLIGVGAFLILRLVVLSDYLFADQSALLLVGTVVPLASNAASVLGAVPLPGLDLTPFAFTVTGLTFGYALFRRRLFDLVPATRRLGRDAAIAALEDGVVILDADYRVVYLNPAAAEMLDRDPAAVLGAEAASLVDVEALDLDVDDALAELELDGRTYEVRSSTIVDRRDRDIGYTLVLNDVTARKRRERKLQRQRDELEQLERINAVIRGVNQALVGAPTRDAVEEAVCERLTEADLYDAAWIAGGLTADDVVVRSAADGAGAAADVEGGSPGPVTWREDPPASGDGTVLPAPPDGDGDGAWTLVPLTYGRTVYGALVLFTRRPDAFGDRELAVLDELGETIGHAINAVQSRRLLVADAVTELELACPDGPLAAAAAAADCRLALEGLVPAAGEGLLVYLRVHGADAERAAGAARAADGVAAARAVGGGDDVIEVTVTGGSALLPLVEHSANIRDAEAADGTCRVVAEVSRDVDVRALIERIRADCPGLDLAAKRELDRPVDTGEGLPAEAVEELTDRQLEALEAAYRAGYFEWPRESTAEDVAEGMGISPPTFHRHLRLAEDRLFEAFFETADRDPDRERRA